MDRRLLLATLAAMLLGCADAPRGEAAYCTLVTEQQQVLRSPAIVTQSDIDTTLALYRKVLGAAPLSVAPEWETLVASLEVAAAVDPADQATVDAAAEAARRSAPAAERIVALTNELCGVSLAASAG